MQNNKCQVANHDHGRIMLICFDKKCKANRAACQICLVEYHSDHATQLADSDYILNYIRTQAEQAVDPKIIYTELEKINSQNPQNLQNICKCIGDKYQILGNQVQGLENQKWNSLAEDMLKDFEVQNCKIIAKECIVNQTLGQQDFKQFTNAFSSAVTKTENQFKLFNKVIEQNENKINFENFTEQQLLNGHTDWVRGIDICKHRNLLASSSSDLTVKLWNLKTNALIKTYEYSSSVLEVVLSKQGNLLAFGGLSNYSVKLIDVSDLKKDNPILELKGHQGCVSRLTFSNDSKYLISASRDKTVIIWDVLKIKQLFLLNSGGCVYGVGISDDDTLLASNSDDGNIRIWNFKNQNLLCTQKAHDLGSGIQFSKNQQILVSCGFDGKIKLWSLAKLNNQRKLLLIRTFKIANIINKLQINLQKKSLLQMHLDSIILPLLWIHNMHEKSRQKIKVLDSLTGEVVKLFKSKETNGNDMIQVAISKDMDIIAYGEDNNIAVWTRK